MRSLSLALLTATAISLTACGSVVDKLSKVGERPELTKVENPQTQPNYKPISWPLPDPEASATRTSNSLWQPGSRAFFRDQRASRVGDILRVNVAIADQAKIDNTNNVKRDSDQSVSAPVFFGAERYLKKLTGNTTAADPLVDITGSTQSKSTGTVDRRETIKTQVAALVTQVLPNGNLVLRDGEGTKRWSAKSARSGADALRLTNGGKLVLAAAGRTLWSTSSPGGP